MGERPRKAPFPMKREHHHILLVDDDTSQQFLSRRSLDKNITRRSTVQVLNSGKEAIAYMIGEGEYADRGRYPFPTLVITDLNMPDGDGFALLEFMQCNREWSVVPRIMFTSSDDDDDVRTAYLLGVSAYHLKPTGGAALDECMRQIVTYWTSSQVPPVDENGRLWMTSSIGKPGERYDQPQGSKQMTRPQKEETGGVPPHEALTAEGEELKG